MVQVRQTFEYTKNGDIDLRHWLQQLPLPLDEADAQRVLATCEWVREASELPGTDCIDWASDSNCLLAGLEIAQILADLHVGVECLLAGILYRAVREQRIAPDEVAKNCGQEASTLVGGVLRMAAISELQNKGEAPVLGQADGQKDNIRKMLIALVDDVRVALIKLAERTCAIRAVKDDYQRRQPIAQEVFDVYAPPGA